VKAEARLQRDIVELAHRLGIMVAHFGVAQVAPNVWRTQTMGDAKGWPDLVLCSRYRVAYAELKDERGRLSDAQRRWLERLAGAGQQVHPSWRPRDWASGEIEAALKELASERSCGFCGAPAGSARVCGAHAGLEAAL
jgi:hypothetical protein